MTRSLPSRIEYLMRGLPAWGTWGSGAARPRHTERIVYVVGGQLGAMDVCEYDFGRRHEFGTTNGFGRGESLGDVGSLGVMDVCEDDFGREFVMPFIERTWTYFFFIFFW